MLSNRSFLFASRFVAVKQPIKRWLMAGCLMVLVWLVTTTPAQAAVDKYVIQYLKASEPVAIKLDAQGNTSLFTPEALSNGKQLFSNNCKSCHVGGANVTIPQITLALSTLKAATPPRDNVAALVAFQRKPMAYDGSEESFWCRQVSDKWMSDAQLEDLAAFILRAAEYDHGWGNGTVSN